MRFLVRRPAAALARFVESIWLFEAGPGELAHARERVLPDGHAQLLVNLHEDRLRWYSGGGLERPHASAGASVTGPFDAPIAIDTGGPRRIVGVAFRADGLRPFVEPTAIAGEQVPLDAVFGRDGATLRDRLLGCRDEAAILDELQGVMLAHAVRAFSPDRAVERALAELERGAKVGSVAASVGLSERSLHRRFVAAVGLTPKRWSRIRRFQRVLRAVGRGRFERWAHLAIEHGYADQSHFAHEFRELAGITPSDYRSLAPREQNHVPMDAPIVDGARQEVE